MYEPQYDDERGGGGFVIGLLCGTAIGAALALMFAPKSGSEIRQTLYDSTEDIRRKAYDAYGQATAQVNDAVSKGRQAVERGREAVERGREAFDTARQSASGTGGDGGAADTFGQNRPGVADFNSTRPTSGV